MTPGLLLAFAGGGLLAGAVIGRRFQRLWLGATLLACVAAFIAAWGVLRGAPEWDWRSPWFVGGEAVHLRLDAISAFFLALLAFVGATAALYAWGYWPDRQYPDSAPRNRILWSAFLLSMGAVLLAANGLHFLIAWELFALCSYFLITLDRARREVRDAGWLYLAASHGGTLCLFAFFSALAFQTGSWELGPFRDRPELAPLFWVALVGFGVKAGLFPLHIWLPGAHANAPSHVSAILSAVALKMGVYGLIRVTGWLPAPAAAGWVVLGAGSITALFGIAFALAQNDLKRLLAYSSVENIGVILVGLGAALLGIRYADAPWGRLALAGALLHVWNHGVFKSLLFFGAGSVLHGTGTRDLSRLGGLWRAMPWTATLFGFGAVAVSALPPLNGFVSEWLIYLGLFSAVTDRAAAAWLALPSVIILGATGALAVACFVKASGTVFLGAPRSAAATHAHETGWAMRSPMLIGALVAVVLALAPVAVWPAVAAVTRAWQPAWTDNPFPSSLTSLGRAQVSLFIALAGAGALVPLVLRRSGIVRGPTWDCGYALPTARMQYTSGSFAASATSWFRWLLRPDQAFRRPRGLFPSGAYRSERTPETVLEHILAPAGRVVLVVSTAVRRLQHGRLQYYVAYVVAGLAGLAALAAAGGKP